LCFLTFFPSYNLQLYLILKRSFFSHALLRYWITSLF
jgi:hypothetical protein